MSGSEAKGDIFEYVQVREERIVLKDHAEAASLGGQVGDIAAVKFNQACIGFLKARNHAERGGLAAAGWAKQAKELTPLNLKRNVGHRLGLIEALGETLE